MSLARSRCAAHMSWSRFGSKTRRPLALPRTAPMARGRSSALWIVDTGMSSSALNLVSELRRIPRSSAETRRWRQTTSVRLIIPLLYAIWRIQVGIHQTSNRQWLLYLPGSSGGSDPSGIGFRVQDWLRDRVGFHHIVLATELGGGACPDSVATSSMQWSWNAAARLRWPASMASPAGGSTSSSRGSKRFKEGGYSALEPRSRRPHSCSHQISSDVQAKVLRLRQELAAAGHDASPETIAHHLIGQVNKVPSAATVWRILKRNGLITPQPHKRPKSSFIPFEAKLPNETWQLDSTPWQLADASPVETLNFLDDKSRLAVACKTFVTVKAADPVHVFHSASNEFGFPASLLGDNAAVFTAGRIVVVGFTAGRLQAVAANHLLIKNYSVLGLHWGLYRQRAPQLVP